MNKPFFCLAPRWPIRMFSMAKYVVASSCVFTVIYEFALSSTPNLNVSRPMFTVHIVLVAFFNKEIHVKLNYFKRGL